jgi:hypothetical protein
VEEEGKEKERNEIEFTVCVGGRGEDERYLVESFWFSLIPLTCAG